MSKKAKNQPRLSSLEERMKLTSGHGVRTTIGDHYICGCGSHYWLLLTNGDCVCASCRTAQARIIVSELAPVASGKPQ